MNPEQLLEARRTRDTSREELEQHEQALRATVLNAHGAGMSLGAIARVLGVSRQRVHQMVSGR